MNLSSFLQLQYIVMLAKVFVFLAVAPIEQNRKKNFNIWNTILHHLPALHYQSTLTQPMLTGLCLLTNLQKLIERNLIECNLIKLTDRCFSYHRTVMYMGTKNSWITICGFQR